MTYIRLKERFWFHMWSRISFLHLMIKMRYNTAKWELDQEKQDKNDIELQEWIDNY